jgi:hypothetical protein
MLRRSKLDCFARGKFFFQDSLTFAITPSLRVATLSATLVTILSASNRGYPWLPPIGNIPLALSLLTKLRVYQYYLFLVATLKGTIICDYP